MAETIIEKDHIEAPVEVVRMAVIAATPRALAITAQSKDRYVLTAAAPARDGSRLDGTVTVMAADEGGTTVAVSLNYLEPPGFTSFVRSIFSADDSGARVRRTARELLQVYAMQAEQISQTGQVVLDATARLTLDAQADVVEKALTTLVAGKANGDELVSTRTVADGRLTHRFRVEPTEVGARVTAISELVVDAGSDAAERLAEIRQTLSAGASANLGRLGERIRRTVSAGDGPQRSL